MADKKEEPKEGEEGTKGKSKKKLLLILIPVVLIVLGVVAFLVLGGKKEEPKEGEEHAEAKEEVKKPKLLTVKLDPFIVNLSENTSFLKTTILLEFDASIIEKELGGAKGAEGGAHGGGAGGGGGEKAEGAAVPPIFTERQPMIRDAVIHVLASKKVQDVLTSDGKERLKEEIIEAINDALGLSENAVVNVYFTEFIIQ